jgi:hypothetical protein
VSQENERLRKQILERGKQKNQSRLTSGRARHMTATKNLDLLAQQDWESGMRDVFKEAAPRFKVLKRGILDYQEEVEKAKKVAECKARNTAKAAARACGCGMGNRGGTRSRGTRGRGRGRWRGAPAAGGPSAGVDNLDSDSEPIRMTELSGSSSSSDSESEAEILIPRSCQQCPVQVI